MTSERFLQAFYSTPNLTYEQVTVDNAERFRSMLQAARAGWLVPTFLPVRRMEDGPHRWYGVLHPSRPLRELEDVARNAVDPSYATITTRSELPGPVGPLEERLEEAFSRSWLRIDLRADDDVRQPVVNALERQVRNLLRRPPIELSLSRNVSRIRADLDLAIGESDAAAVDRLLLELAGLPTVTAENRLYITIDAYSRSGRHRAVIDLDDLDRIIQSRPPRPVRLALLTSLRAALPASERELGDFQDLAGPVGPLLEQLLEQAPQAETVAQVESLLAANLLTAPASRPPWAEPPYLLALLQDLGGDLGAWKARFISVEAGSGSYEIPIDLLEAQAEQATTLQEVRRVVADALTLGTPAAAAIAARAVQDHAPQLRTDRLLGDVVRRLEEIANVGAGSPSSWHDWIAWCSAGELRPEARDLVEQHVGTWGAITGSELELLRTTMTDPTSVTAANLRSALGLAIEHLGPVGDTGQRRELLQAAIQLLAYGGPTSHDERQATLTWVEQLCFDGVDTPAYLALLEQLEEIWRQVASAGAAEWVIDLLAVLAVAPIAPGDATAAREAFTHQVLQRMRGWITTLDDEARDTLVRTAAMLEIELPGIAASDAQTDPLTALDHRSLAIHTLMRSSAMTCVAAVRRVAPDCQIELNEDHVETDRLTALAATADVFALVTGASKHAASRAVERHRPPGKPLVRVPGKGSTMLLRELRTAVAGLQRSVE